MTQTIISHHDSYIRSRNLRICISNLRCPKSTKSRHSIVKYGRRLPKTSRMEDSNSLRGYSIHGRRCCICSLSHVFSFALSHVRMPKFRYIAGAAAVGYTVYWATGSINKTEVKSELELRVVELRIDFQRQAI